MDAPASGSAYEHIEFTGGDFSHQDLSDCTFAHCDFAACNFRAADLNSTTFSHCQFNDAGSEQPADFSQANLREASFSHCNLTVVDLVRCKGYDLTLKHCQLQGADLSNADFRLPVGDSALAALTMQSCNFSYGNLANTYLAFCTLSDCRLIEACFDYCDLHEADLSGSELHNISAVGVNITGADLRSCTFNNINPREIDLSGVRIYFSQLAALLDPLGVVVEDDP